MLEETAKIEAYISEHCGRHIRAAYGCSLGGSFVGLLAVYFVSYKVCVGIYKRKEY